MYKFCVPDGNGGCSVCAGTYIPGTIQNCPSPKYKLPVNWRTFCEDSQNHARSLVSNTRGIETNPLPLGDYTEKILTGLGISKDKWGKIKNLFGAAPDCNCDLRKEWLNSVGAWLATSTE